MSLSQGLAKRFLDQTRKVKRLEAELKEAKKELEAVAKKIPEIFLRERMSNMKIDGSTVYYRRSIRVSKKGGVDTQLLLNALRKNGLSEFINAGYNVKGINSYLVELDRDARAALPDDWEKEIQKKFPKEVFELLNVHQELKGIVKGA